MIEKVGFLGYGPDAASVLFPVIDKRYLRGNRPILLTTNQEPQEWGQVLHDPDLSAAIWTGKSYRQHRPGLAQNTEGGP